ncbi:hypothetical protein AB4K20DRAFT_1863010 [Rhizopus microsporus]
MHGCESESLEERLQTQSQGNKGNLRASTYKECTSKYLGRSKGDYASHRRQQQNNANSSLRQGLPSIEKQRPVCHMYFEITQTLLYLFNIGNNKSIGEFLEEIKNKEKEWWPHL